MEFKKKLKIRLYLAVGYIVLGVLMIVFANIWGADNSSIWGIGLGIAVCGVARLRGYFLITKNEETIRARQIAENDERNIMIASKAKSVAFYVYIMASCITMLVLTALDKTALAVPLSISVYSLIFIYFVSYFIIRKLH